MPFLVRDNNVSPAAFALPATNSTYTGTTVIDTQNDSPGDFTARGELLISVPSLPAANLANTQTLGFSVWNSTDSSMGGSTNIATNVVLVTGNGSASTAATGRFRLPTNTKRYVKVTALSGSALTGSLAAYSGTVDFLF